jgi:hypothetical protein
MRLAMLIVLASAILSLSACSIPGVATGPHNPIEGKWKTADGSFGVEFLPTGDCSAHSRIQGHDVAGPCKYTVDKDAITIHYYGMGANPASEPTETVTWRYTLEGDTLNVTVLGNSLTLKRVH